MIYHDWKIEELPPLPEPWYWERGDIDGDPAAVRREGGWYCYVHEGEACRYTDKLTVSSRSDPAYDGNVSSRSAAEGCIPFSVFEAVYKAVRIFYCKDSPMKNFPQGSED